jgi:hypothetical protein
MRLARILAVAAAFLATSLLADSDPTYTALRAARPDGRTIAVNNLTFDRDVIHITLTGTLHLLAPVDGKTPGAVFAGQGTYQLTPASKQELRVLQINSGDDKLTALTDKFETAVFFGPEIIKAAETQSGEAKPGAPDPRAGGIWDEYMKRQRKDLSTNIHVRLLESMMNSEGGPLFFAWVKGGGKYPPAVLAVDPISIDALRLIPSADSGEQTLMLTYDQTKGGAWYLSYLKSVVDTGKALIPASLVDAENYAIDSKILPRGELGATTVLTFSANADALRVLPINLYGKLRITEAAYSAAGATPEWKPVTWIQEKDNEDPDAAVVFPQPLKAGEKYLLKVAYSGKDVLTDAGDGNYTVGSRESWYPNVGVFADVATYDLTFRFPQKFQIVGVGTETENRVEGDTRISVWKSTMPLRVAGFNYGKFKKLSTSDGPSSMTVDVYTNPGTPDIISQINQILEANNGGGNWNEEGGFGLPTGPTNIRVDTAKLAQSAMADGINTARTGNAFFGPLVSNKRVAITQQSAWFFGQSWPSLIYLPYTAFLDGTTRMNLGLIGIKDFVDLVGPHEFAHQWWGHQVGWRTYHDVWLSEGFAEFTAALVLQQSGGWNAYNSLWEKKRRYILEKPRGGILTNDSVGPISLGWRLNSWQNGEAYDAMVYEKGAYVLHMLRMQMQDRSKKNPDEAFMAAMTEFAQTYAGKNASTRDFQHIVEKHISKNLDLQGNGSLDWFFREWVYGTSIPKLDVNADATDAGGGKYHIKATISQSQVTDDFVSIVPLYVTFDKGQIVRLATVPILGNSSKPIEFDIALPMKPKTITVNAMHDVLAR